MKHLLLACIGMSLAAVVITGQAPTTAGPAFEVASVKPGALGSLRIGVAIRGEELRASNLSLRQIIQWAYNIRPLFHQGSVEGGPAWLDQDGFDIAAKAPKRPSIDEARLMLRVLLADRFKLQLHHETRQEPAFALGIEPGTP